MAGRGPGCGSESPAEICLSTDFQSSLCIESKCPGTEPGPEASFLKDRPSAPQHTYTHTTNTFVHTEMDTRTEDVDAQPGLRTINSNSAKLILTFQIWKGVSADTDLARGRRGEQGLLP